MITDVLVRLGHNYKLLQSFFRATVQFSIASDDCNKACLSYHTQAVTSTGVVLRLDIEPVLNNSFVAFYQLSGVKEA